MDQIGPAGQAKTIIHFVTESGTGDHRWRIACMPNMLPSEFGSTPYHKHIQRTNEARAVTCPACRRTDAHAQAMAALGLSSIGVRPHGSKS